MHARLCTLFVCLLSACTPLLASAAERLRPSGLEGAVLLSGDKTPSAAALERFVELSGGEKGKIVVVVLGKSHGTQLVGSLAERPHAILSTVTFADRDSASDADRLELIGKATGVFVVTSDPVVEMLKTIVDMPLHKALAEVRLRGGVVAGAADSAPLFARRLIHAEDSAATNPTPALDLLPGSVIAADAAQVTASLSAQKDLLGVALPEKGILEIRGRDIRSLGETPVTLHLAKTDVRDARTVELRNRRPADYNELRRAALGRNQPAFPPATVPAPEVPSGALVIIGGGGMPTDITKKFVELGGGEKGRFVVFPTAMPDPLPRETMPALLKRFGATEVVVISAREQAELEDPKNLEILEKATAIWFGGGRQWRFVDCYEGTKLHDLMHGVLKRGGVIAGSSAGATIQGEYLARGAPVGPNIMMCEGYERGLCFLPGVAIDQHFTQRNRFPDMTALMKTYPQYLGIGLDEATAIVVTGHTAEVMGRGKVHFYDRTKKVEEGQPDYEAFPAGAKYDLKDRKALQ